MLALVNFTEQRVSACLYIVLFLPSLRVLFYDSRILFYESFLQIIIIFYLYFPSFIHPRLFFFVAKNLTEKLAVNFLLRKKLARNKSFFYSNFASWIVLFFFFCFKEKRRTRKILTIQFFYLETRKNDSHFFHKCITTTKKKN